MTAPWTFFPRKSSADLINDLRKIVVTSETVKIRSTGTGSDCGVATLDAAGVLDAVGGRGDGEDWRTLTLYAGSSGISGCWMTGADTERAFAGI